jgi:signal transduction histidine kinase
MLITKMLQQKYFSTNWTKVIVVACLMGAACLSAQQISAREDGQKVLILNPYPQGFDWSDKEIQGIPLTALPANSVGLNTPDSLDDNYPGYFWGGVIFFFGQTLIIIFLVVSIMRRRKAEEKLKLYSELLEERVFERTQELKETQTQLIHQERLATLGQLAGSVAHELHNPLSAIKNAAYFLNMSLDNSNSDVAESLKILNREVKTSEHIINTLLEFAYPEPAIRRRIDLNELLQQIILETTLPENIEFINQLDPLLPPVYADPEQLEVVFHNLVRNAVQAMSVSNETKGQLSTKSTAVDKAWVIVSVKDTGVGISPEILDKLFEPLFTTKAKGIGLGLALSKILIEENGGIIKVESSGLPGQGSTFTVYLPLSNETGNSSEPDH